MKLQLCKYNLGATFRGLTVYRYRDCLVSWIIH